MDTPAKQQVVERIKQASKILVTVSNNPSVDQLAACVGTTLLLNRMQKHATAVFSGAIPSTIEFLKPEKTIETNTDSLRDFIISLDKSKADKLRYKVENQVVRIFITPYRSSLSEKDLVFSQGDFNVEVVLALGVTDRSHIDAAITAHGRILHDATVISVNAGPGNAPDLGQINWQEPTASSLSEMLVSISEAFGTGLVDNQMATAFLTGIVAETERFKNTKTTPRVMTIAAQLMAAGANQQLISKELEPLLIKNPSQPPVAQPKPQPKPESKPQPKPEGILDIPHELSVSDSPGVDIDPNQILIDQEGNLKTMEELKAEREKPPATPAPTTVPTPASVPTASELPDHSLLPYQPPGPAGVAPANLRKEDEKKALDNNSLTPNTHALLDSTNNHLFTSPPFTADTQPGWHNDYDSVPMSEEGSYGHSATIQPPGSTQSPPSAIDSARNAVESSLASAPFDPSFAPPLAALNAQPVDVNMRSEQVPPPPSVGNGTPSLPLPNVSLSPDRPQDNLDMMPPAPPPVPPPLPLSGNPGVVIPNPPSTPPPAR